MRQKKIFHNFAKYTTFPICLTLLSWFTFTLIDKGVALNNALTFSTTLLFILLLLLEKIIPYQEKWNVDTERGNDIFHTFFGTVLGAFVGLASLILSLVTLWLVLHK